MGGNVEGDNAEKGMGVAVMDSNKLLRLGCVVLESGQDDEEEKKT